MLFYLIKHIFKATVITELLFTQKDFFQLIFVMSVSRVYYLICSAMYNFFLGWDKSERRQTEKKKFFVTLEMFEGKTHTFIFCHFFLFVCIFCFNTNKRNTTINQQITNPSHIIKWKLHTTVKSTKSDLFFKSLQSNF